MKLIMENWRKYLKEESLCGPEQLSHCNDLPLLLSKYADLSPDHQKMVDDLQACCDAQKSERGEEDYPIDDIEDPEPSLGDY